MKFLRDESGMCIKKPGMGNYPCESQRRHKKSNERRPYNMKKIITFLRDEEGATAVEYGIMVALIAVVIIIAVTAIGVNLDAVFAYVGNVVGAVPLG